MIERRKEIDAVRGLLARNPVVGIIGARQVGKTTLARQIVAKDKRPHTFFDLENSEDISRLSDPMLALKNLKGLVIIDEIQRYPDIFPVIRVLVDRPKNPARFVILGSASPNLLRQGSETLAGRIVYHELKGLALDEVGVDHAQRLWLRGGFPRSFLASSSSTSDEWRRSFIKTYIERDLPQLGINIQSYTLYRFWSMLAHYHGQTWNASEFGRSFGIADTTVRHYLDLLASTFVVRLLLPWHENISKRQVRAPKVYIADSGLLHTLINVRTMDDLQKNPKIGASWEGLVIEQIIRRLNVSGEHCFFWATHSGAELDLFVIRGNKRLGFEVKLTSSPSITQSMKSAIATLKLNSLTVIHAGEKTYFLDKKVRAVAFKDVFSEI